LNKPLVIEAVLLKQLLALGQSQKQACWEAISELPSAFGQPHRHLGLGIRKLRPHSFECRAGLGLRILFRDQPDGVHLCFVGTHDEVQKELKSGKYG
jgi:hypothetical protein